MEREKIIFLRNLFLRMFVVGIVIALLLFGATLVFWNVAAGWVMHLFSVDEKTLGRIVLTFFTNVRIVVLFFFLNPFSDFLQPSIAPHRGARSSHARIQRVLVCIAAH